MLFFSGLKCSSSGFRICGLRVLLEFLHEVFVQVICRKGFEECYATKVSCPCSSASFLTFLTSGINNHEARAVGQQ